MSKKRLIIIGAIIVALIASYSLFGNSNDENSPITTQVIKGQFLNEVIISGEAQSTSSKKIMGLQVQEDIKYISLKFKILFQKVP